MGFKGKGSGAGGEDATDWDLESRITFLDLGFLRWRDQSFTAALCVHHIKDDVSGFRTEGPTSVLCIVCRSCRHERESVSQIRTVLSALPLAQMCAMPVQVSGFKI